jgi:hypothetical protein
MTHRLEETMMVITPRRFTRDDFARLIDWVDDAGGDAVRHVELSCGTW